MLIHTFHTFSNIFHFEENEFDSYDVENPHNAIKYKLFKW